MLDSLNEQQRRAAEWDAGPLIVLAGPGTGKTRVIIARIARLIDSGAKPESILGLAFNVKAAAEMRARLAEAVGPAIAERVHLSTFHAFGRRVIARFGDMLGFSPNPTIMDSAQKRRLLRSIIRELDLFPQWIAQGRDGVITRVEGFIADCRNAARSPRDARAYATAWLARAQKNEAGLEGDELTAERERAHEFDHASRAYEAFERRCVEKNLATFDDFLAQPLRLLREKEVVGVFLRDEIHHIVVDEFQDANPAQIELLRHLAPPHTTTDLCAVGDDDQAIYAFRGADTASFTRFANLWKDHETIALSTNYRSAAPIVAAANAVIARANSRFQPDKKLTADPDWSSHCGSGGGGASPSSVEAIQYAKGRGGGKLIAAIIRADRARNPTRRWRDYAVLSRGNTTRDTIATELAIEEIPVDLRLPDLPASNDAVRDLFAWLRAITDPSDTTHIRRLLVRPPMSVPLDTVREWEMSWQRAARSSHPAHPASSSYASFLIAEINHPAIPRFKLLFEQFTRLAATESAASVVEHVIRSAGLLHADDLSARDRARRVTALAAALRFARNIQPNLDAPADVREFLSYYDDLSDAEQQFNTPSHEMLDSDSESDDSLDAVRVLTAHKSKGLEFDTVFCANVRPRGFPGSNNNQSDPIPLPPDFSNIADPDPQDEERRLFYVACTRAKRRLVLLAETRKDISKSIDYFNELTLSTGLDILKSTDADWLTEEAADESAPHLAADADSRRRAVLDRAIRRARHDAFAALHDAARSSINSSELKDIDTRLAAVARALSALSALGEGKEIPATLSAPEWLAGVAASLRAGQPPETLTRALTPPLTLSYSHINAYEECPRCFYARHILNLGETPTSDTTFGSVVHRVLQSFYTELSRMESEGIEPDRLPGLPRLLRLGEDLMRSDSRAAPDELDHILSRLREQLTIQHQKFHDDAHILAMEQRFDIPFTHRGVTHRLTGNIDRLDRLADNRYRIVDYKTGRGRADLREPPATDLQFGVYALALPRLIDPGAEFTESTAPRTDIAGVAEYWLLATGERGSIDLAKLRLDKLRERIGEAIDGMLAARFDKGKKCKDLCWILDEH
ncbi:MAG TPA: ATP-dependent DNA helicase [Phycisphaerales bacterium]|nr:ATP-dependent DNA helicase [Phycisphaerales bacterium]